MPLRMLRAARRSRRARARQRRASLRSSQAARQSNLKYDRSSTSNALLPERAHDRLQIAQLQLRPRNTHGGVVPQSCRRRGGRPRPGRTVAAAHRVWTCAAARGKLPRLELHVVIRVIPSVFRRDRVFPSARRRSYNGVCGTGVRMPAIAVKMRFRVTNSTIRPPVNGPSSSPPE